MLEYILGYLVNTFVESELNYFLKIISIGAAYLLRCVDNVYFGYFQILINAFLIMHKKIKL